MLRLIVGSLFLLLSACSSSPSTATLTPISTTLPTSTRRPTRMLTATSTARPPATATQRPTAAPLQAATGTQPLTATSRPTASPTQPAPAAPQPPQATTTPAPPIEPLHTEPTLSASANVIISFIQFDGAVDRVESDEYAQITNKDGAPVNLAGWRLNADDEGQDFWFPSFELQPGQSCRVYTDEHHPDTCGFSFGSSHALWANGGQCGHLYNAEGVEVSTYCY